MKYRLLLMFFNGGFFALITLPYVDYHILKLVFVILCMILGGKVLFDDSRRSNKKKFETGEYR